jgi:hypothetical protein
MAHSSCVTFSNGIEGIFSILIHTFPEPAHLLADEQVVFFCRRAAYLYYTPLCHGSGHPGSKFFDVIPMNVASSSTMHGQLAELHCKLKLGKCSNPEERKTEKTTIPPMLKAPHDIHNGQPYWPHMTGQHLMRNPLLFHSVFSSLPLLHECTSFERNISWQRNRLAQTEYSLSAAKEGVNHI